MKYSYAYKTSDGVRHEASIEATCRDEAFAELRKRGIKPIKVVAADGSKANGELRGVRKRVVALGAGALVVGAIVAALFAFRAGEATGTAKGPAANDTSPRHQIYGDPAIMEKLERGEFGEKFSGNEVLAWFAQPGKIMAPKGAFSRRPTPEIEAALSNAGGHIAIGADDSREIRELCEIVNGMKDELAAYLRNGNGTVKSYYRRLVDRTAEEMQIYERIKRELEGVKGEALWEQKNESLRKLGLRTIPNPHETE